MTFIIWLYLSFQFVYSEESCSERNYSKSGDATKIYYEGNELPGVDPKSFAVLKTSEKNDVCNYSKDKTQAFFKFRKIEGASLETFAPLSPSYARDSSRIFYEDQILKDADPKSFQIFSKNNEASFDEKSFFFRGKILPDAKPQKIRIGDEKSTFLSEDNFYCGSNKFQFKYENIGGHQIRVLPGVCSDGFFYPEISPKGFTLLWNSYAKNKQFVLHEFKPIESISEKDEIRIEDQFLFTTKSVFWNGKKIQEADPQTFQRDPNEGTGLYARDSEKVFKLDTKSLSWTIMPNIDAYTFRSIGPYLSDKNGVYYDGRKIESADPVSFDKIPFCHTADARDVQGFYFKGKYQGKTVDCEGAQMKMLKMIIDR